METMLITGAAGFIGRAACRHYSNRYNIIAVDDMSRPSALRPVGEDFKGVEFHEINALRVGPGLMGATVVLHLAGQVSVVDSIENPHDDFLRNALLGFELARFAANKNARVIYANTNKVFGELEHCYAPIGDNHPIDPKTPYGISKATAGLYLREFLPERCWDFRQGCIYGESQYGSESQGWVGHIRNCVATGTPIRCFGTGRQVRDLLHVNDLLNLYDLALDGALLPGSYTVGGGGNNAVSFQRAVMLLGGTIAEFLPARPADQMCFVSANEGVSKAGWSPTVDARSWLIANAPTAVSLASLAQS